jgi:hypothetical protein
MTKTFSPYGKADADVRHAKAWGRLAKLCGEVDTNARNAGDSLLSAKAAIADLHDALHRLRCGYNLPGIPSEEDVKTWIGIEVARVFGQTGTFLSFLSVPPEALATPDKVPPLFATFSRAAKQIRAAQEEAHKAERKLIGELEQQHVAEQSALREALTQSL